MIDLPFDFLLEIGLVRGMLKIEEATMRHRCPIFIAYQRSLPSRDGSLQFDLDYFLLRGLTLIPMSNWFNDLGSLLPLNVIIIVIVLITTFLIFGIVISLYFIAVHAQSLTAEYRLHRLAQVGD